MPTIGTRIRRSAMDRTEKTVHQDSQWEATAGCLSSPASFCWITMSPNFMVLAVCYHLLFYLEASAKGILCPAQDSLNQELQLAASRGLPQSISAKCFWAPNWWCSFACILNWATLVTSECTTDFMMSCCLLAAYYSSFLPFACLLNELAHSATLLLKQILVFFSSLRICVSNNIWLLGGGDAHF